jgi:hypothetical protein
MDLDRVTLLSFGVAVRRRVRRLDIQFLWQHGLLRGHEQSKDKNGQPVYELHYWTFLPGLSVTV